MESDTRLLGHATRQVKSSVGHPEACEVLVLHLYPCWSRFVLGDYRDHSLDSRDPELGFVPLGAILGNAPYIFFPAGSWERFGAVRSRAF